MSKRVFKRGCFEPSRPPSADEGAVSRTLLAASLRARLGKRAFQTGSKGLASPRWIAILSGMVAALPNTGCRLMVNPFTDELASQRAVSTASVDGARAAEVTPTILRRSYESAAVSPADGTVTHGPLYFEDAFEDLGSDDGRFAWTGEDYLQLFYWRGRFLLNSVLLPVSAVAAPPWVVMASDGKLGKRALGIKRDARRWSPPDRR